MQRAPHPPIETRAAILERVPGNLIELRFKAGVKMDLLGLGEIVRAKRELCGTEDLDVLAILPAELDFGLEVMAVDHRAVNGGCGQARRLALIAQNSFDERLVNIYFRYHPRAHDTAVFANEADARNWLDRGQPGPSLV